MRLHGIDHLSNTKTNEPVHAVKASLSAADDEVKKEQGI
jgi:hypothetical protein